MKKWVVTGCYKHTNLKKLSWVFFSENIKDDKIHICNKKNKKIKIYYHNKNDKTKKNLVSF